MTAAILVGGLGSRLRGVTGDETQKVLYPVAGKPLVCYSIDLFNPRDVHRIIFCLGHLAREVRTWGEMQTLPFQLDFMQQERAGVAAVVKQAFTFCGESELIVCNGDEIRLGLNLESAIEFHGSQDCLATMVATDSSNLSRHRVLSVDTRSMLVSSRLRRQESDPHMVGLINTGLLILKKEAVGLFDGDGWSGIIDPLCRVGALAVHVQPKVRYFNVGTSEEYHEASRALASLNTPP